MNKKEALRITELIYRLCEHGFTDKEVDTMRRIQSTLHRWCEAECNGDIERMTGSNKPERVYEIKGYGNNWQRHHYPIPDRENGAIKRMHAILANHPGWDWYYQTDPRGCSVYLYRVDDPILAYGGVSIESCYNSIGIAIH